MVPDGAAPGGHQLELVGELAGLMALGGLESEKPPLVARAWSETMVAGAGFGHCFMRARQLSRVEGSRPPGCHTVLPG